MRGQWLWYAHHEHIPLWVGRFFERHVFPAAVGYLRTRGSWFGSPRLSPPQRNLKKTKRRCIAALRSKPRVCPSICIARPGGRLPRPAGHCCAPSLEQLNVPSSELCRAFILQALELSYSRHRRDTPIQLLRSFFCSPEVARSYSSIATEGKHTRD